MTVSIEERARRYVASMPPSVSGSGGHDALFNVVRALIHGFGFTQFEARPFVDDFNLRCDPQWSEREILHKLRSVDGVSSRWPRGYLRRENDWKPTKQQRTDLGIPTETEVKKKVEFELEKLQRIAAPLRNVVKLPWLANRSSVDPATVSAADFLRLIYPNGEKILVFGSEFSQGDALWPEEPPVVDGRYGIWYLPQPVSGEYVPNPEGKPREDGQVPLSRRTWRAVKDFRYFVIESDEAPVVDWLAFIARVPLRIEALYTSGSRSVHALVRVDCRTKEQWDEEKRRMMPFLMGGLMCGADRGTWSAVRLSRLPGCIRRGKLIDEVDAKGEKTGRKKYVRYDPPGEQKLLYVRPNAPLRPICELPAERDVEKLWTDLAALGVSDADETAGEYLTRGLRYYARVSPKCREALARLENNPE